MIVKQEIVQLLRYLRILSVADYGRYLLDVRRRKLENEEFTKEHPEFTVPPSALAYDAYGHTNSAVYYFSGKEQARFLSELIRSQLDSSSLRICEWGCGPGRVIRHLPEYFPDVAIELHGADYNRASIEWCEENLKGITFRQNQLAPPLPFKPDQFDCLYALSVFTHLSEEMHFRWIQELSRVVTKDGLIVLTTHGDASRDKLLEREQLRFDNGELVVRGQITEGKRCFVAYHPVSFVREQLLEGLTVVSHLTTGTIPGFGQDVWVVRNTKKEARPTVAS